MKLHIPYHYYITYSLPAVILSILGMTYFVYLPKVFADETGVSLTALGFIILFTRIWDAVIDPVIGMLSDKTQSKWGRRKPWIVIGALGLSVLFYFLFNPPSILSSNQLTIWLALASLLFFIFWTAVTVPYEALGVELTFDYDQRTRLLGFREGGIIVGTFLAALMPFILGMVYGNTISLDDIITMLSFWYSTALLICCGLAVLVIHTPQPIFHTSISEKKLFHWQELINNKPFCVLLFAFALTSFGQYLSSSLLLFYTEHVLGVVNGSVYLVLYLGITFCCIPFWLYLTTFIEKRLVWILSMLFTVIPFLFVVFLGKGDTGWYTLYIILSAMSSGGMLTLPASMQADVIDLDEHKTGLRREGLFIGVWALFRKLSAAFGIGLAFPILDWFGYVSSGEQSNVVINTLSFLYAGVPCMCYLSACVLIWHYPITRNYHKKIRFEIDNRLIHQNEVTV